MLENPLLMAYPPCKSFNFAANKNGKMTLLRVDNRERDREGINGKTFL